MISEEYIVTSALCFQGIKRGNLHDNIQNLRCGVRSSRVYLKPIKVIEDSGWNDLSQYIAVIRIEKIKYSTVIRPACVLNEEELLMDSELTVVGTGETRKPFQNKDTN